MTKYQLIMLIIALGASGRVGGAASRGLEAYAGKDLRRLRLLDAHAAAAFRKQLQALTGDKPERSDSQRGFAPWWVARFHTGKAAWMLLEAYPGYSIPDVSAVRVHLFDENWRRQVKQSFPTGYRFFLDEAKVVAGTPLKQDLLMVRVTCAGPFVSIDGGPKKPAFEQGEYQRQYYALLGDRLVLVRLEDDQGRPVPNNYRWSAPPKGPPIAKRGPADWIDGLGSTEPVQQLEALVWLSGEHLPSSEPRHKNVNQESLEDSRLLESVRRSPKTREALRRLAASSNPWVREYAQLALRVIDS